MRPFKIEIDCSRSALAIGGYSATDPGLHGVQAHDTEGRCVIPATALRGALRMSLEALLRGRRQQQPDAQICAGGNGAEPAVADSIPRGDGCKLGPNGGPCVVCRLFGSGRGHIAVGERAFSMLAIGDAVSRVPVPFTLRHSVGIARSRRSAEEDRLFNRWGPPPGAAELRFVAEAQLLTDDGNPNIEIVRAREAWRLLRAAATATMHIGGGRSRGLGRVDIRLLVEGTGAPDEPPPLFDLAAAPIGTTRLRNAVRLRVCLEAPASIGLPLAADNQRDCRPEIPGSALRGAVGFALAEALPDPDEPGFQYLVDENKGAVFDFLYPVDKGPVAGWRATAPWPRTARTCKYKPYKNNDAAGHGLHDALIDFIAVRLAGDRPLSGPLLAKCSRSDCEGSLEQVEGTRGAKQPPKTRLTTRVQLARKQGSAADHALFTQVLMEPGQWFEGSIRAIPASGAAHLEQALSSLPIYLGRGRHRGWGRVKIEIDDWPNPPSVAERAADFDMTLARRLTQLGLPAESIPRERLIVLTLLSPLLLEGAEDDGRGLLAAAIGRHQPHELKWLSAFRRFGVERGWNQRHASRPGPRDAAQCVLAGSVFVATLPSIEARRDLIDALEKLEQEGAGGRRRLGFGRILAFDPFIARHTPAERG